jgi:hypothetical protein
MAILILRRPFMTALLARIGVSLLTKLITETFLAKLLIEGLRAWARTTANRYDDKVVEAAAAAFGIEAEALKDLAQ